MCRRTMKKSKSILSLLLTVILIVGLGFTVIAGIGKSKTGAMKNIKLGLDLAGGVSITYQVKDKNPTKEEMSDTIYKLQKRVEQYSTEASVYQEGDDRTWKTRFPFFPDSRWGDGPYRNRCKECICKERSG